MILLGLTGGVGMGKSTSAAFFQDRSIPVIDTDSIARDLVNPGEPALREISASFGREFIGPDGRLLRRELAQKIFSDTAARARLESILHPRIRQIWQDRAEAWSREGIPMGVVVIPLLFETGAAALFDSIICVACSGVTQRVRLRDRGWSEVEIENRKAAQMPVAEKMQASDFVVWTETNLETHARQIDCVFKSLSGN